MALIDMFVTVFGGEMSYAYINELPAAALARHRAKLQIVGLEACPYQQPTNRVVRLLLLSLLCTGMD